MVVSLKPVVAGGLPQDEDVSGHVLVAFMGQVPTKVFGQVNPGDYILPGGYHNGFGVAKSPELMRPQDYKKVLGVAWEGNQENGTAYVNTAIGLNTNDLADIVQQQDTKIKQLESQMTRTNAILADLVPGFAEKANISTSHDGHDHPAQEEAQQPIHAKDLFVEPTADQIVYIEIEKGQLEASFAYAKKITKEAYEKHGLSLNDHPFWKRIDAEAGYKDEVLEKIAADLTKTAHVHQDIYGKIIEKK
jgi:hypothetical protein